MRRLDARDTTHLRSIPVTTVARTLVDLAEVLDSNALADAVHEAEVKRLLDVKAIEGALECANGRRGTAALRAALAEPFSGITRSELERRFRALCERGGLPSPKLNVHLPLGAGLIEVDALWPSAA